jgi:hypothetical protein
MLLEPRPTAALILRYDGTHEDLPRLAIRLSGRPDAAEYVTQIDTFLHVPQKQGPALRIAQHNAAVMRRIDAIYRRAGGAPV